MEILKNKTEVIRQRVGKRARNSGSIGEGILFEI